MIRNRMLAVGLTTLSLALAAGTWSYASTSPNSNAGVLQRLYMAGDGTIDVTLAERPPSAEDCGDGQYYFIPRTHPFRDTFRDTLLMAWSTNQRVNFRVQDGHVSGTHCEVAYIVLNR